MTPETATRISFSAYRTATAKAPPNGTGAQHVRLPVCPGQLEDPSESDVELRVALGNEHATDRHWPESADVPPRSKSSTIYPCQLSIKATRIATSAAGWRAATLAGVTPVGLVFPGDKNVPNALTNTYYKGFAPRLGINWSPAWNSGLLGALAGGPARRASAPAMACSTIRSNSWCLNSSVPSHHLVEASAFLHRCSRRRMSIRPGRFLRIRSMGF